MQLKKRFGTVPRELPKKAPTLALGANALQERARALGVYLAALLERDPRLRQSEEVYAFLSLHLYVRSCLSLCVHVCICVCVSESETHNAAHVWLNLSSLSLSV
jgi:hypothetical protein